MRTSSHLQLRHAVRTRRGADFGGSRDKHRVTQGINKHEVVGWTIYRWPMYITAAGLVVALSGNRKKAHFMAYKSVE